MAEVLFRDVPLNLTAHPVTGNITLLKNIDAVKQSVKNIVMTNAYERKYNRLFGGDVISQMFENFGSITDYNITQNIRIALRNFEPRVIVDDVVVKSTPDSNLIEVSIVFRIQNNISPLTVSLFLERVR